MPRKPVGTLTQHTAEWFAGNAATAGGLATGPNGSGICISLYNDAPAGQYLWVWEVDVYNDAEGAYRFDEFEGDAGTLFQQGVYVMAGRGAAFGHTSFFDIPSLGNFPASPSSFPGSGYTGDEAGTTTCYRPQGPIKVLPPNYSWGVFNEWAGAVGGATLGVMFYYSILPYIPQSVP